MKDREILDLFWKRDESAISETANAYGNYCYTIAYNILNCNEDAEECVNDTWMNAWKSIPPYRPNNLSTYLGKITRNLAFNRYKFLHTQKRGCGRIEIALSELVGCVPEKEDLAQLADEITLINAIESFLRNQTPVDRKVFIGKYWYLYSNRDLANAYSTSESKVASLLYRMRNKLKLHLEKEGIFL